VISQTYSDPFLKQLSENNPKDAAEYFKLISESKFKDDLAACLETPQEILTQIGVKACRNPNFPADQLEELIKDQEILITSYWDIFASPNLSKEHIQRLMKNSNPNVRGLALAHEYGDPDEFLIFLQSAITSGLKDIHIVREICRNRNLTDEVFQYLLSVHEVTPSVAGTVGAELWSNPFLSPEQRAALVLYSVDEPESKSDYWGGIHRFYASTLAFLPYFKCTDYYSGEKVASLNRIPESYVKTFAQWGHPLGLLLHQQQSIEPVINLEALNELISEYNLLHRLFWPELCEREDFEIYRRNAYRTDDLFISHPVLGREFEEVDDPSMATQLGGVFIFSDNYTWLSGDIELSLDMAVREMESSGETLAEAVSNTDFDSLGIKLVAFTFSDPELADKYGYKLKENAASEVIDTAISFAEQDSFDVSAEINSFFPEMLSWRNLPEANKRGIFELLKVGSALPESKAASDSVHFLGCMALHGDTPDSLLKELSSLGIPIVDEVLASRAV
jgi:hypothetical protein